MLPTLGGGRKLSAKTRVSISRYVRPSPSEVKSVVLCSSVKAKRNKWGRRVWCLGDWLRGKTVNISKVFRYRGSSEAMLTSTLKLV